ncbi:hypothetical protein SAMN04487769_0119 [Burkholderia sp. b14]|nr:hypothetical protein SAMN04487769_0119 [Burkholderia sp. b14]
MQTLTNRAGSCCSAADAQDPMATMKRLGLPRDGLTPLPSTLDEMLDNWASERRAAPSLYNSTVTAVL